MAVGAFHTSSIYIAALVLSTVCCRMFCFDFSLSPNLASSVIVALPSAA